MKAKEIIKVFLLSFFAILIFTLVDYFFHFIVPEFSVPSWYFRNKLIYGTLIGFIFLLTVKNLKLSTLKKSFLFSLIVVLLLQIRYLYYGYTLQFHLFFIPMHFLILFATSLILFNRFLK